MKRIFVVLLIITSSILFAEELPFQYSNYQYDPSNEMEYFQYENKGTLYTFMKLNIFSNEPSYEYNEVDLEKMKKENGKDWTKYIIIKLEGDSAKWITHNGKITILSLNKSFVVESKFREK